MQLTKRGVYALRTLTRLGVAQEMGRVSMTVSELAAAERLPLKFVEQILIQLRVARYVETERGQSEGYFIGLPFEAIRFSDVIRLIDGLPAFIAGEASNERGPLPNDDGSGLRMVLDDVRSSAVKALERYTLHDVVEATIRETGTNDIPAPFDSATCLAVPPSLSKIRRHADSLALLHEDQP